MRTAKKGLFEYVVSARKPAVSRPAGKQLRCICYKKDALTPFSAVSLAGAGVKGAAGHGTTDEFGHIAVEKPDTIYDFHATILHLLGLKHTRLTFYHNRLERRLTDVHGEVITDVVS